MIEVTSNLTDGGEYVVGVTIDGMTAVLTDAEALELGQRRLIAAGQHFKVLPELRETIADLHARLHRDGPSPDLLIALGVAATQLQQVEQLLDHLDD
jgi:hypothetical protein